MRRRRGIVIASVAVVGAASLWIALALMQVSAVAVMASDMDVQRTNALLRLESALQVLLSRLHDQRADLAVGVPAVLPKSMELWRTNRRVVVATLHVDEAGVMLHPEAARLDVNHADAVALRGLGVFDESAAQALIAARDAQPGKRFADMAAVAAHLPDDVSVHDLLTVYAFAPVWVDGQVPLADGQDPLEVLSPEGQSTLIGMTPEPGKQWAAAVAASAPSPEAWGEVLTKVAWRESGFYLGRVDINTAPEAVLRTLPGLDEAKASHLVAVREGLDAAAMQSVAWPWTEGVLSRSAEARLLPHITVGCWTWRCTVRIGERSLEADADAPLSDVTLHEVVLDVSGEMPRIAMVRDVRLGTAHIGTVPVPVRDEDEGVNEDELVADNEPSDADSIGEVGEQTSGSQDAPGVEPPLAFDPFPDLPEVDEPEIERDPVTEDPRLGRWR